MTDKDVLLEKELLEEAAAIKRFEYFPLGKELKKQTSVTENQYLIEFDKQYLIKQKWKNQQLKNIVDQIKSTAANSVFTNIITFILIVFLLNQNLEF